MDKTTLYRKHAHGIGVWEIWAEGDTIYYRHAVVVNGSWQTHTEQVFQNQSGRTLEQQIKLQIDSRVSRMLDKGYKRSYESAVNGATNQLGLPNPMLAHPITRVSVPPFSEALQQATW